MDHIAARNHSLLARRSAAARRSATYTYETASPRVPDCERCGNDITAGATVVVTPTSNPKRAHQTFVCGPCADHLTEGN